jgi:hypothetical protein
MTTGKTVYTLAFALLWLAPAASLNAATEWVAASDRYASRVLENMAKFSPEGAGGMGVDGLDEEIVDLRENVFERRQEEAARLLRELEAGLEREKHPFVRQDLNILIKAVSDGARSADLNRENMLPYFNMSQQVFQGIRALIDDQIPRERYPAAIVRMNRYAGLDDGYVPITDLARARTEERFDVPGLQGPYRGQVEQDLERSETFVAGIGELLDGTDLQGWQDSYAVLAGQLRDYSEWVRAEILPRARDDFRLPPVMYENALRNWGVDSSPAQLIQTATAGYMDIRNEMEVVGALVANKMGYASTDYRDVVRQLKKDGPIDGDKLLDHYSDILGQIEEFLVAERIITLPEREAGIRIATAAETAAQPAPHLDIPRMIGNTGEYPYFVIPQIVQNEDGSWPQTDDTYVAGSWTLTAHEARPGHEMQFSSIIEGGVSMARAIFAFNSANVEGWGLYAEAIAKPYMPLEGQLISLQYRLMRAARSYTRMQALRTQTELALREQFDQQAFHDFVLAQGLLPPELLSQAVMTEFVPSMMN